MFEHVGEKNYHTFFQSIQNNLKQDASFLLHTIGVNWTNTLKGSWIERYIFPNGNIPSQKEITHNIEHIFIIDDWHNFGCDYDKTLMRWYENFVRTYHSFKSDYYDERFFRTWSFYLLSCAGCFRARNLQLWQILLTPTYTKKAPFDIPKVR